MYVCCPLFIIVLIELYKWKSSEMGVLLMVTHKESIGGDGLEPPVGCLPYDMHR